MEHSTDHRPSFARLTVDLERTALGGGSFFVNTYTANEPAGETGGSFRMKF